MPVPADVGGIDFARVHRDWLPTLVLAGARPDASDAPQVRADTEASLRAALAVDPGLSAIFDDLVRHMADPEADADLLLRDVDRWNARLVRLDAPWRIEGAVLIGDTSYFYVKCYRVLLDAEGAVEQDLARVRLVQRVDSLNVVERYLGAARADDGAVVVVDRVVEYALDDVWPLLADDPNRPSGEAAWRDAILAELRAALPADDVDRLVHTAPARARLLQVARAVQTRHACGARLVLTRPPWDGYADSDVQRLWGYAAGARGQLCPDISDAEALAVDEASAALRASDALAAVEGLAAVSSRAFATHESRHVGDAHKYGEATNVPCSGCDPDPNFRAELSAYTSALADRETSAIAAWQACTLLDDPGTHGRAVLTLVSVVGEGMCVAGPPPDLAARAAAFARERFDRTEAITLPAAWPARVPVEPYRI